MVKNRGKIITAQELNNEILSEKGKAGGWPNYLDYTVSGSSVNISVDNKALDKKAARRLDSWGLAFLIDAERRCGIKIKQIDFSISGEMGAIKPNGRLAPGLEAFRRRISFLSINNPGLHFGISINTELLSLEDSRALFNRPDTEIIRQTLKHTPKDNGPFQLEKSFQTWLFGNDAKKEDGDANTNERLAVLGGDFLDLKKRGFGIDREFPTGAFHGKISNSTRILPTEFVDIITLNKHGQLAVIELKLNDEQLEVIAQILDYSLFFRCYIGKLLPIIQTKLGRAAKGNDIVCYVVNNHFHVRFDDVYLKYYRPKNNLDHGFDIVKVVLGQYPTDCRE